MTDDLQHDVPALQWIDKPDWCAGCKMLDTPWHSNDMFKTAVSSGVGAFGPGPKWVGLGLKFADNSWGSALYQLPSQPLVASRSNASTSCGQAIGSTALDGRVGDLFWANVGDDNQFVSLSEDQVGEFMTTLKTDFVVPKSVVGFRVPTGLWSSSSIFAVDYMGDVYVAYLATGSLVRVAALANAPPGNWAYAQVVDDVAFAGRWDIAGGDWWTVKQGVLEKLIGGPGVDILELVSDGTAIVWKEGTNPTGSEAETIFQNYALRVSPYATTASGIHPKTLLDSVPRSWGSLVFANGYVAGVYYTNEALSQTGAIVVRVSDGRAWRSILPDGLSYGQVVYPAADELWGAGTVAFAQGGAQTIVRIPYDTMELLQTAAPDGGAGDGG